MIRVAVCGQDAVERIRLRDAVEHYAGGAGMRNIEVIQFAALALLEQAAARMRDGLFDLCICRIGESKLPDDGGADGAGESSPPTSDSRTPSGLDALRRLHAQHPDLRMIIVSNDKSHAIHAYDLDAGFFLISDTSEGFKRAMNGPFAEIARSRRDFVAVKSSNGIENVVLADIQFIESSKRGIVIHLPAGKTVSARGTLQALYENLTGGNAGRQRDSVAGAGASDAGGAAGEADDAAGAPDDAAPAGAGGAGGASGAGGAPGASASAGASGKSTDFGKRFIKAGSSFIVNLDNVRSAGEGSLVFADGEVVIVPVRKRKAVLGALHSYWLR